MKKVLFIIIVAFCGADTAGSLPDETAMGLALEPGDILVESHYDGGYHLWVRKREGCSSVLLTETTADPANRKASYALRAKEYNPINGDEKRLLNGKPLDPKLYSLIDSTPKKHVTLGEAFHIFIPYVATWGYAETAHGDVQVVEGTWFNIRTFAKPYGDYAGAYRDNPFILRARKRTAEEKPVETPGKETTDKSVNPEARSSYKDIADRNKGTAQEVSNEKDTLAALEKILGRATGDSLDLVVALDTTLSMEDELDFIRKDLVSVVRKHIGRFPRFRVGLVFFKDYDEEYLVKSLPWQTDMDAVDRAIREVHVMGGRDKPEAVYEALHEAVTAFSWHAAERLVILVGDAPPHPRPRGKVDAETVQKEAAAAGVTIETMLLPH